MRGNLPAAFEAFTNASVRSMSGEIEDRRLDCKLVDPAMSRDGDKKNFAAIVSGFANADGGVILWGVDARKNAAGIDCVVDFPGVADAARLESRLMDLTGAATSPGVVGVEHKSLPGAAGSPSFVVTYVPSSDGGPHMALLGENRYYQRIGSSTLRMEHHQVADMFGRRAVPVLNLELVQTNDRILSARLTNVGRGIARAPYLLVLPEGPFIASPVPETGAPTDFPLPKLIGTAMPGWGAYVGDMNRVIHPGTSIQFRVIQPPMTHEGQLPQSVNGRVRFGAAGAVELVFEFEYDFHAGRLVRWAAPDHARTAE